MLMGAAQRGAALRPLRSVNRCPTLVSRPSGRSLRSSAAGKVAPAPTSAKQAVEEGLAAFNERKDYGESLRLFKVAMELSPSDEEAIAALYNAGCAHAKQREWRAAADSILRAVNGYNLKLSVALQDKDLRELRDTREWLDMMTEIKGGLSRDQKIMLRTEAKAPFRFARTFIFGGLAGGAGLGLLIITGRLVQSLQGGPNAPPLTESLTNFGINATALAVLAFFLVRDLRNKEADTKVTTREEALSRLLIKLGPERALPLIRFRGVVRPVIVAGDRSYVERQVKAAEPYQASLRARGVSVVPVVYTDDPNAKLKALKKEMQGQKPSSKGFGRGGDAADGGGGGGEELPEGAGIGNSESLTEEDRRWRLEPAAVGEWEQWLEEQKEFAGMERVKRNVWVQVQLDGTVRSSDVGSPPWARMVADLPPLDSFKTKVTDGIGPSL
ncbi:MAG: hypothetical protein J3K34DRAFT_114825 [Monoraphidium minutum]|nr:MAG: hypothetical protein J3K34DRAFT_114825 [Monoraphidium minutum]